MSLTARILPPEEWHRLKGTEAELYAPYMNPERARVMVVEDEGRIVATWSLMWVAHAECCWVAPSHRGVFGVTKRLLRIMRETAKDWSVGAVITGSLNLHVTDLIKRLGGTPMPMESFILPIDGLKHEVPITSGSIECRQ